MRFPKLTKKQKAYHKKYNRTRKISDELLVLHFGGIKDAKCTRCNKKINISQNLECRKKQNNMFKGRNFNSDTGLHFGLISKIFYSVRPFAVCCKCQYDIYRFMGKIPDIMDSSVFPRHLLSVKTPKDLLKSFKNSTSKIHYQSREYPYTAKKLEQFRKEAVKAYLKKYPYVKYTYPQLLAIVKSSKKYQKVGVWN